MTHIHILVLVSAIVTTLLWMFMLQHFKDRRAALALPYLVLVVFFYSLVIFFPGLCPPVLLNAISSGIRLVSVGLLALMGVTQLRAK